MCNKYWTPDAIADTLRLCKKEIRVLEVKLEVGSRNMTIADIQSRLKYVKELQNELLGKVEEFESAGYPFKQLHEV